MTKLHYEQLLLGRYLWERINVTENTDLEALKALVSLTFNLMEIYEGEYVGYMWDLCIWIGLKRDAPDAFEDYGMSTRQGNPEYFEKPIQPPKITLATADVAPLHPELLMLGRYLWERINVVKPGDTESVKVLSDITTQLVKVYEENSSGFMRELHEWVEGKKEGGHPDEQFGERIKVRYSGYFAGVEFCGE